jgi:hypothetical protein
LSNLDKKVEPVTRFDDENFQLAITDVGHQTECDIDRKILAIAKPALPKRVSAKTEKKKLQQGKIFLNFIENRIKSEIIIFIFRLEEVLR